MTAHGKSKHLMIAIGTALLATGVAWSAAPPAADRAVDRESAGSAATTSNQPQAGDQADPVPDAEEVEAAASSEARTAWVTPAPDDGTQDEQPVGADVTAAVSAPILDAASSRLTFQALLVDAAGDPLPGPNVELRFQLYDGVGAPLGAEVVQVVPIANGVVDTLIPVDPRFFDGTARQLGVIVNRGLELVPLVQLGAVPYAIRVDRVMSEELDDTIDLGDADVHGTLHVWNAGTDQRVLTLSGFSTSMELFGSDGLRQIRLQGPSWGEIFLHDGLGNHQTVTLSATSSSGGQLTLTDDGGLDQVFVDGGTGTVNAVESFNVVGTIASARGGGTTLASLFQNADGGQIQLFDDLGTVALEGGAQTGGGYLSLRQLDGGLGVEIDGDAGTDAGGVVDVYDAESNLTIRLDGDGHEISLRGDDGVDRVRLSGASPGEVELLDDQGDTTVLLSAGPTGGALLLSQNDGTTTVELDGDAGTNAGADLTMKASTGLTTIFIDADSLDSGTISIRDAAGSSNVFLDGADAAGGGLITVGAADVSTTIKLIGESAASAGLIQVNDSVSQTRVQLDGESTGTGGEISVYDNNGTETIELLGDEASGGEGGSQIMLRDSSGTDRIEIDANGSSGSRIQLLQNDGTFGIALDGQDASNGSQIRMWANDGSIAVWLRANSVSGGTTGGGRILVYNPAGAASVFIDGDWNNSGLGRIRADVIRVQGGVDLAEPFECKDQANVKPGMVMSIDPDSPGKLMMSTQAYDRKVAGIVSGAGGVRPGLTLSQKGVMDDGPLVALMGRVYCLVDASNGPIAPGDMLTTSNTPGHAMKVNDYDKARGAILGKAMTSLEAGKGLVLVLVQPQ